ncbi:DNA-binding protein [Thalassomonas viridans]|uniref:DNA-binding protein n=1 Tax=Thalassomonas viridans TaxID=137584 RepID=A0AAE9Z6Y8_9GAMM|nr:Mor transcription activator family protein [Thalassomonas viridans]WDE07254.1 DNA-binding protein [Thalassomonas viridans]
MTIRKERSAALLMQVILLIETELGKYGIDKDKAELIAKNTCDQLRQDFGGEPFYFPKGKDLDVILAHHEIYDRFNGHNQVELAKEFNMSVPHIYRLLKKVHKEEVDKRQPKLF